MNANQKTKLAMYNAVVSFCEKNLGFISSIAALQSSYSSLKDTITSIAGTTQKKVEVLTGVAIDKANTREALSRAATGLAAQVYAYANANKFEALKEKVNFSVSSLQRLKDVELPAVCKNILKAATENAVALAKYNVTAHMITDFTSMIRVYEGKEPDPRNALTERKMHNVSLISLIRRADNLLKKEMDKIIAGYKSTNPEFYNNYMNNRMIVDASSTSTQIKGKITDHVTGKPIEGAKVNASGANITVMTNVRGNFVIKLHEPGKCTVTVSKAGFKTLTFSDQVVKLGKITKVKGEMEAI